MKRQRQTKYRFEVADFPPEMLERLRMPHDYILRDGKAIFTQRGAEEAQKILEPFSTRDESPSPERNLAAAPGNFQAEGPSPLLPVDMLPGQ